MLIAKKDSPDYHLKGYVMKKQYKMIGENRLKMRQEYWPDVSDEMIWDRPKATGFVTIPRTLPLFHSIMDELSDKPVSKTYFALWCRSYDEFVLVINNSSEYAYESGFTSQRAVYTWKDRMRRLRDLGFIKAADGPNGEFSYVLILNPYFVVKSLKEDNKLKVSRGLYNALIQRTGEIKAKDLDE